MKHQFKKYSRSMRTLGTSLFIVVAAFSFIFFVTKDKNPHISELSFVEHSVLGKKAGSVIPASCNSSPSTSHWAGDCTSKDVRVGFGSLPSLPTATLTSNSQYVSYGAAPITLTWSSTGALSCFASASRSGSNWGGIKTPVSGSSQSVTFSDATLANYTASAITVTYSITCGTADSNQSASLIVTYYPAPTPVCADQGVYPNCWTTGNN